MKKPLLLLTLLIGCMSVGMGQSKQIKHKITYETTSTGWTDSIGYEKQQQKIPCIAYTQFEAEKLIYLKADTIIKKYSIGFLYKKIGRYWIRNATDNPIVNMGVDGTQSTESEVSYWLHNKQIYPIEIIKTPITK